MKSINKSLLIASCVLFSNVSMAGIDTWQWNLETKNSNTLKSTGTNTDDSSTIYAELTAYADTGGSDDSIIERSVSIPQYGSGWGMKNQDNEGGDPEHAFDNKDLGITQGPCPSGYQHSGRGGSYSDKCYKSSGFDGYIDDLDYDETDYDMALLSFDTSVELTEVGFSWVKGSHTDFTVLAYEGAGTPTLAGQTWATLSDWVLVGSYKADNGSGYYDINSQGKESQHWLIGAFNDILDPNYNDGSSTDAFKIKGVKGATSAEEVPAPAAFGLMLLGLFGLYARRNKVQA